MEEDIQYLHYQTISRIGIWTILKTQHWRRKWPPPPRIIIFKYRLHIFPNTILWRNPIIIKEICSIFDYTRRMNWQVRNKQGFFLYTFWVKKFAYSMVYLFYIILFFSSDLNTYRYASIFGDEESRRRPYGNSGMVVANNDWWLNEDQPNENEILHKIFYKHPAIQRQDKRGLRLYKKQDAAVRLY